MRINDLRVAAVQHVKTIDRSGHRWRSPEHNMSHGESYRVAASIANASSLWPGGRTRRIVRPRIAASSVDHRSRKRQTPAVSVIISDFNRRQRLRATYSENIPSVRFLSVDENPARSSEAMIAPGGTQASIVSQ